MKKVIVENVTFKTAFGLSFSEGSKSARPGLSCCKYVSLIENFSATELRLSPRDVVYSV